MTTQAQTRTWFAQVIVPGCDQDESHVFDGVATIEIGALEAKPGEARLAFDLARNIVDPLGCWVSAVWFEGGVVEF
jgi:hypothetical protein